LLAWNINNKNWQEEDDSMALPDLDNIVNSDNALQQSDAAKPKPHLVIRIGEVALAALLIAGLTVSWLALVRMPHSSSSGRVSHSRTTPTPIPDISSPLTGHDVNLSINDGILYAGSADNAIYALRMSDGSMLWRYHTQGSVDQPPLIVNGIVYVSANMVGGPGADYSGIVYALRASDGTLLWHFTRNGYIYTPVVVNGVAYIGAWDNTVSALRAIDGTLLWRFPTRGPVFDPLLVVNGIVYVSAYIDQGPGFVYALRASDGNLLWLFTTQGGVYQTTVVHGVAYVDSAEGITALRVSDGTHLWHFSLASTGFSVPVVLDGIVYTIAVKVSLADASSGGGGYMARTISGEETIPFKSGVSSLYALRASDGTPLWHYTMNNGKSSWGTLLSITNGVIYTGANADTGKNSIYALQASDGTILWHYTTDDAPTSGIVANGIIYIGSNSSAVFALHAHDGALLWRYTRIGQVFDTPILSGNYLYVSAINGIVYALQLSSGSLLWYYQTDING
jgi:outer membrane protein assembly factor BamB